MKTPALLSAMAIGLALSSPALATSAERRDAGTLADGTKIESVTLRNARGVSATILTYGATLQSLLAPDRKGRLADIVLGYDDPRDYESKPNYFGATIGRFANRIAGGRFMLDGTAYQLPVNNGVNTLHGGGQGFDRKVWTISKVSSGPVASVAMTLTSPDGDAGYPGKLDVTLTYWLDEAGNLGMTFDAVTDRPTIVNLTNHALFNMAGAGGARDAMGNRLTVPAGSYTPVDATLIPTGELRAVTGGAFDFRRPRVIAQALRDARDPQIIIGRGYDHNFALDKRSTAEPGLAARLEDPASGRTLEVLTTEPGLQFYTGNFLDGTLTGKGQRLYRMGDGIALEPQKFPDAPNHAHFASARLDPGQHYRHAMIYRLTVK